VVGAVDILGAELDLELLSIPVIAALIGYGTNWIAVKMLFFPVRFWGVRLNVVRWLAQFLPRRVQALPGLVQGGIGWQGIIPARAAKMGSIAVDKGIAKLGSPREFYDCLDPEAMADHIIAETRSEIRELVERIVEREHPGLWRDVPPRLRERIFRRVEAELPAIAKEITRDVGEHIEQLFDVKLMVIRHIEENPALANRIFLEVGAKELRFIINSGLIFGFILGVFTIPLYLAVDSWLVLPVAGVLVGYLTNWIALRLIFQPMYPHQIGPFNIQGLFMRRQPEVADVYAKVIADDVVTMSNVSDELLRGPRSDRTRALVRSRLRPAVDRALGAARLPVRVAFGVREYESVRESLATEAVDVTMAPLRDPGFEGRQSAAVRELLARRMRQLPEPDFAELLRAAVEEDEWMLILLGGVLGFIAGCLQIAFVL
jgi:uncharacterized membrane protein YheB (UPF0754 family)